MSQTKELMVEALRELAEETNDKELEQWAVKHAEKIEKELENEG